MQEELKHHFTDTIFYEIELTSKFCKMLGAQVFEKYQTGISIEEFSILDTLLCNPGLCQRDIAKLILRDRANTGKLLDTLEKKGYLERTLSVKNNRPVKIAKLTEAGIKKTYETTELIKPHLAIAREKILNSDLSKLRALLKEFRTVLNETIEIKI